VISGLTVWLGYITYFSLLFGLPVYVMFGLPLMIWYLRRNPPHFLPIILLGLSAVLGMIPLGMVMAAWAGEWGALEALPFFLGFGAIYAVLWSGTFALLYRWLITRL